MKLKSKISMIVLAAFFLLAGNALATPIVDVTYDNSSVPGDYKLTFTVVESSIYDEFIVVFGVKNGTMEGAPAGWTEYANGYSARWINWSNITESVTGFVVGFTALPDVIEYLVWTTPQAFQQLETGVEPTYTILKGKISVPKQIPEPLSILLLGFGLMGLAGVSRKLKK